MGDTPRNPASLFFGTGDEVTTKLASRARDEELPLKRRRVPYAPRTRDRRHCYCNGPAPECDETQQRCSFSPLDRHERPGALTARTDVGLAFVRVRETPRLDHLALDFDEHLSVSSNFCRDDRATVPAIATPTFKLEFLVERNRLSKRNFQRACYTSNTAGDTRERNQLIGDHRADPAVGRAGRADMFFA